MGEANRFRGLAYYKEFGRLITTETTDEVVNLVFIDIEHSKDIVDMYVERLLLNFPVCFIIHFCNFRVPIDCTRDKIKHSKVRYVACVSHEKSGLIYSTDMGLGQIYLTNMKNGESTVITHTINGTNILKHASGIAAEPSGKVLEETYNNFCLFFISRK